MPATGQKRAAPGYASAGASGLLGTASGSKKRKTDVGPKYYAVKAGAKPGVYMDYSECQKQTAGFKGAIFKSFTSRQDAEAFVAGKKVDSPSDKPARFYAVAVSNKPGIYTDWADVAPTIVGVKGPKYKKFNTRVEAVEFILEHGNKETIEALGDEGKIHAKKRSQQIQASRSGILVIYTDGSSRGNGKVGSRAGFGVFFGHGDPRNIAGRLAGEPQTNQRAELQAIYRALDAAPVKQTVQIVTDSRYSINAVTQWAAGWKRKGWKTSEGEDVKNQDIIRAILERMEKRSKEGAQTFFKWVKGHDADEGNEQADALANQGALMPLPSEAM